MLVQFDTRCRWTFALPSAFALLLLSVFSVSTPARAAGPSATTTNLPAALRPVLYKALAKDVGTAYQVGRDGCATLPKQDLKACFDVDGAHFTGAAALLSLRMVAFGRHGKLISTAPVRPVIAGNQANYAHGNLTEWWRGLPVGFEQGFTIAKRPSGNGELTLTLAMSRQDAGAPNADAASLRHSRESGNPVKSTLAWGKLRYGDLVVTDAKGKVVPATLKSAGDRVLIAVNDSHAVYPLTVDPLVWLEQKVTPSDGTVDDEFGYSVAVNGASALVGARFALVNGQKDGAAYVFTRADGAWTETVKLIANDGAEFDNFGVSVALSDTTALVGAPAATVGGKFSQGAAYVFSESNGTWTQAAKLTASDGAELDDFGSSVALSGTTALIGTPFANVNGNLAQGAAYVFTETNGVWTQTQKLSTGGATAFFGTSVALDGTTALVGAPMATVNGNYVQGAAYVLTESGGTWSQTATLVQSDDVSGNFGAAVALDGTTAVVGAPLEEINGNEYQGAAYIFNGSGGTWTQIQKLTASDGAAQNVFGNSVAVYGSTVLVAARNIVDGHIHQRAGYLFTRSGGTWTQTQKFSAPAYGYPTYYYGSPYNSAVALGRTTALVAVPCYDDSPYAYNCFALGKVFFYSESDLGLAVSAPQTVGQGQQYVNQTIATNNASAASPAVAVTVAVPAAAGFVSATATQGSCREAAGVVTCKLGQINGNAGTATANVTLQATGSSGTTIENTASVAQATPALTASAPTQITSSQGCPAGYTAYGGTLAAHAVFLAPSYEARAGEENAILTAPAGFALYVGVDLANGQRWRRHFSGTEVHRWGPAGAYSWGVKAGDTGGAYTFCLNHP